MRLWLKTLREERQMTMKMVADKLSISESYYCAIENGSRQKKMDVSVISGLASALSVPIAQAVQYECEYARGISETVA